MRYRILVRPIRAAGRTAGHVPAFRPHGTDRPATHAAPGRGGADRLIPSTAQSRATTGPMTAIRAAAGPMTAGRATAGRMAGGRVTAR